MKKLMILGASYSQIPLYKAAKDLGVKTVAASTKGDWPGFSLADECAYADISKPSEVLKAAREFGVNGIATCCVDAGVRSLGYACETLGLPGLSKSAGEKSSDKYKMKEAFQEGGVRCARHILIRSRRELEEALEKLPFPVIVKAVDLMGSRGIFRCDTKEEALLHYEDTMAATRKDYCLVEEFIQGKLMGCEAMMYQGELLYCLPNNTLAFESTVPTPVGHSVPYEKQETLGDEVKRQVMLAIKAVGLDDCPVNCDLIEKDGKIYVIEITGRAGATCLPEIVGLMYDINYYEAIARLALGMPVAHMFEEKGKWGAVLAKTLSSQKSGKVKEIRNENLPSPDLIDLSFNIRPGEEVRRYQNGRDRIGQVILAGDGLWECKKRLEEVLSKISIEFNL